MKLFHLADLHIGKIVNKSDKIIVFIPPYLDSLTFDELADIAFKE